MQQAIEGLQEIRELANQFSTDRLRPHVERWDHERAIDADVRAQLAELGFHGMLVPESKGGLGFPLATWAAVLEEIAWGEPACACELAASGIVACALSGIPDSSAMLERIATGEQTGAVQLSCEADDTPAVVGDAAAPKLTGAARWILRGAGSDTIVLNARAGDGVALHIVAGDAPGIASGDREDTLGLRSARIERVRFTAVEAARVEPEAAEAARIAMHLGMAAIAAGIAKAALEHATGYADVREQFSRKLRGFEGIRVKLADMSVRVAAARSIVQSAAVAGTARAAAEAKVFGSEAAMWVTTHAVQIFGGYGYMRDYPVEKMMRDAKATEVLGSTNDECRAIIAGALYHD